MKQCFMRFPEGRSKVLTLSYDDGSEQDIKLIGILDKYGIKATFNISSGLFAPEGTVFKKDSAHRTMTRSMAVQLYKSSGHEVAVHGYSHPFLSMLPPAMAVQEILSDRQNLESDYGMPIRGMAYPFDSVNDDLINTIRPLGIGYARTTNPTKGFGFPSDWLRLRPTCHHNDADLMNLLDTFINKKIFYYPIMFYLWGHSYEFDQNDNWNVIEEFCARASESNDIWYATNIEIYDYVKAYNSLIWSADMSMVQNPSAITVHVAVDIHDSGQKLYTVHAGELVKID